jgi:hypothetical protein
VSFFRHHAAHSHIKNGLHHPALEYQVILLCLKPPAKFSQLIYAEGNRFIGGDCEWSKESFYIGNWFLIIIAMMGETAYYKVMPQTPDTIVKPLTAIFQILSCCGIGLSFTQSSPFLSFIQRGQPDNPQNSQLYVHRRQYATYRIKPAHGDDFAHVTPIPNP